MIANMPSVAMNGGNRNHATTRPLIEAATTQARKPSAIAGTASPCQATLPATTVPNTMIAPAARSMPETRMISVCPSANVPITTDCWAIRDMLPAFINVDVVSENAMNMTIRAKSGPAIG
jgi:hypothetical protein